MFPMQTMKPNMLVLYLQPDEGVAFAIPTEILCTERQFALSLTSTEYEPGLNPLMEDAVELFRCHLYEYGPPAPPLTDKILATPLLDHEQLAGTELLTSEKTELLITGFDESVHAQP